MTTLYHATKLCNLEDILSDGLTPSDGGSKLTSGLTLQYRELYGVYGFENRSDAVQFAEDNNYHWDGYALMQFNTADGRKTIDDPEYDKGVSYYVLSDCPIPAFIQSGDVVR